MSWLLLAPLVLTTDYILRCVSRTALSCTLVSLSQRPNKTLGGGAPSGGSSYAQRKLSSLARRAAQQQQQPLQHQGELQFTLVMSMLTEFAKIDDKVKRAAVYEFGDEV